MLCTHHAGTASFTFRFSSTPNTQIFLNPSLNYSFLITDCRPRPESAAAGGGKQTMQHAGRAGPASPAGSGGSELPCMHAPRPPSTSGGGAADLDILGIDDDWASCGGCHTGDAPIPHVPPPTSHDHDRTGRGRPDPQQSTPALHHLHGIAAASYGVLVHVPLLASSKARILASHHICEMDRSTT
jgi:hypothetical protein